MILKVISQLREYQKNIRKVQTFSFKKNNNKTFFKSLLDFSTTD
jgi:hypothetical protein